MVRIAFWAALAVGSALAAGCGPGKELPDDLPNRTDSKDTQQAVPKQSEPAAKETVAKAVRALTGGKPELVRRAKAFRATLRGQQFHLADEPIALVRTVAAVWPDRITVSDARETPGLKGTLTGYLSGTRLVIADGSAQQDFGARSDMAASFRAEETSVVWVPLLFATTDPNAVVFDARVDAGAPAVSLSVENLPVFHLWFDPTTHRPARVAFVAKQAGATVRREWSVSAYKPHESGLLVPTKLELRFNGELAQSLTVEKWEFPDAIPDAEFAPPPLKK